MSDLESQARRIIGPMCQDIGIWLSAEEQAVIARWCVKTMMVFESLTNPNRKRWFGREKRRLLRLNKPLPKRLYIWVGRYSSTGIDVNGKDMDLVIPNIPKARNGCLAHILANHLVIQIASVFVPPKYDHVPVVVRPKPGPWADAIIRVWPASRTVAWPPRASFYPRTYPTLADLAGRFSVGV